PADFGFPFEILLFPAIMAVGTALGILVGSRLPIRKPLLTKPKEKRTQRGIGCAVVFGLFGGFLGGAALGGTSGDMLNLRHDQHTIRMALFFGGAGVGAITGPILCGLLASKLIRRASSESPTQD